LGFAETTVCSVSSGFGIVVNTLSKTASRVGSSMRI